MRCDDGRILDLALDPPCVVNDAVKMAVARWRIRRIDKFLVDFIPQEPDFTIGDGTRAVLIDFSDEVGKLIEARRGACSVYDAFEAKHKAYLSSAACGGQWTQTRIASVPGWSDDKLCQLCKRADGTPEHRFVCPAIMPHGGWQPPPPTACDLVRIIG